MEVITTGKTISLSVVLLLVALPRAGVYVPMFAAAILATPAASGVPLKGILVGNGAAAT